MNLRSVGAALVLAGVATGVPALAHHSFNMFDMRPEAEISVQGVVKQWALINPHSWLTITVTNPDGTRTDWSFEAAAVAQLIPKGINIETYKVGSKVMVVAGPLKDGRPGGVLKFVQHADGTYTLPNDVGNIGQQALDRWKAKNPKADETAPARSR
jgi:Family of unknown function (DUF6152)